MHPRSIVVRVTQLKSGKVSSYCTKPISTDFVNAMYLKVVADLCERFKMERKEIDNFYGAAELRIPGNDELIVVVEQVPNTVFPQPSAETIIAKLVETFPFTFTPA